MRKITFLFFIPLYFLSVSQAQCVRGDCVAGKGTFEYTTGDVYEGEFLHGNRHGKGHLHMPNGDAYDGEWKNDKMHGQGVYSYRNGDVLTGEFSQGMI
ncbi:MAG: hypothetical protein NWR72_10090, partial [Bacteroidia bacterium]|nr:hypothetical protein [Bacteroidia bacterium]